MNKFKIGDRVCIPSSFNATGTIKTITGATQTYVSIILDGFGSEAVFLGTEVYPLVDGKKNFGELPAEDFYGEPKCECGSLACGSPKHSVWCKLYTVDK